jgi:hypothetical protein
LINFFPFFFPFAFSMPDGVPIVFNRGFSTRLCCQWGQRDFTLISSIFLLNFSRASCFALGFRGTFFFFGFDGARFGCAMIDENLARSLKITK